MRAVKGRVWGGGDRIERGACGWLGSGWASVRSRSRALSI